MHENEIITITLDAAFKIHRSIGPGLLESVYKECLCFELTNYGLLVEKEKPIPLIYSSIKLNIGFRADLIIEKKVVIETKSIDYLCDVHYKQLLTYLRLTDCKLGLLLNFNVSLLKDGIKRVANNL